MSLFPHTDECPTGLSAYQRNCFWMWCLGQNVSVCSPVHKKHLPFYHSMRKSILYKNQETDKTFLHFKSALFKHPSPLPPPSSPLNCPSAIVSTLFRSSCGQAASSTKNVSNAHCTGGCRRHDPAEGRCPDESLPAGSGPAHHPG